MAVTAAAVVAKRYWITDAALNNYRERTTTPAEVERPKLEGIIDSLIHQAIIGGKVEDIFDDHNEESRLVQILDDPKLYALLKKSNIPDTAEYAAVTIVLSQAAEKKLSTRQWRRAGGMSEKNKAVLMSVTPVEKPPVSSSRPAVELVRPQEQPKTHQGPKLYLVMYRSKPNSSTQYFRSGGEDVTRLINEIDAVPGSVEVFKQLEVGLHIVE